MNRIDRYNVKDQDQKIGQAARSLDRYKAGEERERKGVKHMGPSNKGGQRWQTVPV